jgi:site-specific recombinase XerD
VALAFTGRAIHTLTMPEIEAYMRKAAPGASSWNHLRVALVGLFNHATARGWAESNPAAKLDRITEEPGLPAVFAPADAGTLQFRATA